MIDCLKFVSTLALCKSFFFGTINNFRNQH
nr:MAG TPA: hypothetical protein [Caudoviricetes sp.]